MNKRAWLAFAAVQIAGCVFTSYGSAYSPSSFERGSWLYGLLLLLPGNLPATVLSRHFVDVQPPAYIFFPIAVACNAMVWVTVLGLWQIFRCERQAHGSRRYSVAFAATGLIFVAANIPQFVPPITCFDCPLPYGLPFTFYREGGRLVIIGLAADVLTILVGALLLARLCQWFANKIQPNAKPVPY